MISNYISSLASKTQRKTHIGSFAAKKHYNSLNTVTIKRIYSNKVVDFVKYAYNETFGEVNDFKSKQEKNKEKYKQQKKLEEEFNKEYSEEELAEFAEKIPEWKRTAMTAGPKEQEKQTLSHKLRRNIMKKIEESDTFKELRETDQYKEWKKEMKDSGQSYGVFKENIAQKIDSSNNPVFKGASVVYNKAKDLSKQTSQAIAEMKRRDPDFNYLDQEDDSRAIFQQIFTSFLYKELSVLEECCSDTALAFFKVHLNVWEFKEIEPKYPFLWHMDKCFFQNASIVDGDPNFTFSVACQEIYCLQKMEENADGVKEIEDGADDRLQSTQYIFSQAPNYEADVDQIGHSWRMTSLYKVGDLTMIV